MEITPRQQQVLDFIREFSLSHGFSPTFREIGKHFGIKSPNGAKNHINALLKKGFLCIHDHLKSRAFVVVGALDAVQVERERIIGIVEKYYAHSSDYEKCVEEIRSGK